MNTTNTTAVCSASQLCRNNGTCNAQGQCACPTGFSGQLCELDACANVKCELNAKCVNGKCESDPCLRMNCYNGGTCLNGVCTCKNNFTGPFCQQHPCASINCINGGFCKVPGICYCLNGYTGKFCENSPCANVTCLNGGKCLYGTCACQPEWSGIRCERPSESARDFKIYRDTLDHLAQNVTLLGNRMQSVHNYTKPQYLSATLREMIRTLQTEYTQKVQEENKKDWMTPKVIGIKPVTKKDMRMPNTPFENARIYEDKDLAYKKAREIKDKKLAAAFELVGKYDEARKDHVAIISKEVPGGEYFKGPFGGFAEISDKYNPVDASLLEQDLDKYRREMSEVQSLIEKS